MVFGAVQAGEAANTIPSAGSPGPPSGCSTGTPGGPLPELVTKLIHDVVAGTGATVEVDYSRGVPPVVNDRMATAVIVGPPGRRSGRTG